VEFYKPALPPGGIAAVVIGGVVGICAYILLCRRAYRDGTRRREAGTNTDASTAIGGRVLDDVERGNRREMMTDANRNEAPAALGQEVEGRELVAHELSAIAEPPVAAKGMKG
jgi:hypothetical protein